MAQLAGMGGSPPPRPRRGSPLPPDRGPPRRVRRRPETCLAIRITPFLSRRTRDEPRHLRRRSRRTQTPTGPLPGAARPVAASEPRDRCQRLFKSAGNPGSETTHSGRLDDLKRRYPELGEQWTALRDQGRPQVRSQCEGIISETEAILAELIQTEKDGADQLVRRRDTTRQQLESIAQGFHVNDTYLDNVAPFNHRFLDTNR